MKKTGKAFFVKMPFTIEDLIKPHLLTSCKPYIIHKTITLSQIQYENLVTDLCVDRWYIDDNKDICCVDSNGIWNCIFVKQKSCNNGVIIMSDGLAYPKWAGFIDMSK